MNQQEVKLCYVQTPVTIPGVTTSATTLDASKIAGIKMYMRDDGGLTVHVKNLVAYIPAANIKIALLLQEEKPKGK